MGRGFELRSIIAAAVSVLIVAPLVWMSLDREPPYEIISGAIDPERPTPGATIMVNWTVKTIRSCRVKSQGVTRELVDSKGVTHTYTPTPTHFTPGDDLVQRVVQLPDTLPVGVTKYHSIACYSCNPLQELFPVCIHTPDITFIVEWPHPR